MKWMLSDSHVVACCGIVLLLSAPQVRAQSQPPAARVASPSENAWQGVASFEIPLDPLEGNASAPVVTALAASHDGKYLAAAGDDHAIRIIEVQTGETLYTMTGHRDWIQSLVFASDSYTIYSAGNDGRILQWSYGYPVQSRQLLALPYAVRSLSISTAQGLLAIGGFSEQIIICDLNSLTIKHRLQCDCGDQRCVRFSPDGMHLLCGGRDGALHVWNAESGQVEAEFHEHRGRIHTASFSSDGLTVTSVGEDRQVLQYDLPTGRVKLRRELAPSKLMSMCMINNDLVAVAGAQNSIYLYDALSDEVIAHLQGHMGTVAVMTPCGNLLASGSFDTTVRIWDVESIDQDAIKYTRPTSHAPIKMDSSLQIR